MRIVTALALLVSLAYTCLAEDDWISLNRAGSQAFHDKKWAEAQAAFEASLPLATMPLEQAITANNLGACFNSLERIPEALMWFERAVALWRSLPGHSEELAETALGLVDVYRSLGRFVEAEQTLRSLLNADLLNEHKAALLNTLADMLAEQSRRPEALVAFQSALALKGISRNRQLEILVGLADIDRSVGNSDAALEKGGRAVDLARKLENGPFEAVALRLQALVWYDQRNFARAEPLFRRSLAVFQKQDPLPQRQIAAALSCLADLYREQGKYSMAEDAYLQALEIERKNGSGEHPHAAVLMESLANLYTIQKRYTQASDLASHAWTIMSDTFGENSLPAAGALASIALIAQSEKRYQAASDAYARALETMQAKGSPNDQNLLSLMDRYAGVLATLHRREEAKQLREQIKAFRLR
jgi:tetratricopeptide (TPR) repeat protein